MGLGDRIGTNIAWNGSQGRSAARRYGRPVRTTMATRPLGRTALPMTELAFGGAPIGGLFTAVSDDDAHGALTAAWAAGVRVYDTAALYGHGLSEERFGRFLRDVPRDEVIVSSKVGRILEPSDGPAQATGWADDRGLGWYHDFTRDGVLRAFDAALGRLGIDRLDVALVHDPDDLTVEQVREPLTALAELRDQGVVRAVGLGMNGPEMPAAVLADEVGGAIVDCLLIAGRYTLLDRSASDLYDECHRRGVGVLSAAPFNSGLLAGLSADGTFHYAPPAADVRTRAEELADVCARHGVPLAAAALQAPLRHPAVATVVTGARCAAHIEENVALLGVDIPDALWDELGV